jgi:PAS domain S-box-containing protein
VVITFIDINELKETEQELVRAKASLEERVRERIRDLDEANQRLAQARDLFYALFHANPIPTSFTRLQDGFFIDANDAYLEYYGFEREALVGQTSQALQLPLDPSIRPGLVERVQKEGILRNVEVEITHPSGEQRTILVSLQLTSVENALITAFIDITERVKAEQQIRALASELTVAEQAERQRVAQILHDDLQQRIFAILMQLSFLKDAYEKNDLQAFAVDFPQLETWLTEAIRVTRQLSVDLSPPILHGEGLLEATLWLASQMQDQYGLEVAIQSDGKPGRLDEKIQVLVFYAVRELLFNIVKHSETLKATVNFEHFDSRLRVVVMDQGKGFNPLEVMNNPKIAHGLLIVRHRLNLLGCKMNINSQLGKGTEVTIEVPYQKMDT